MRIVYNGCVFARVSLLLGEAVLSQRAVFFFINLKICVAIVN